MSMEHHSSNQVENNPLFELSSESLNKLDEVLNSDSVKQLLSDSKSLENLAAAILDNEAPTTSAHASASNINVGHSAPGHVATVQEGMDLVDALDSLVNQLTNQNQMAHPSNSTVNQPYARDNGPDVDYLGGNLEIGSSFDENWVDSVFLDHTYSCVPVKQQGPPLRKDSGSDFSGSSPNTPQRRSLRQIEKIEKSVLEKIKAENQEMLKREREEMGVTKEVTKPKSGVDESCLLQVDQEDDEDEEADDSLVIDVDEMGKPVAKKKRVKKRQISTDGKVAPPQIQRKHSDELENVIAALSGENSDKKEEKKTSGRSQRQRRKPKRWDDDEVEVDFSGTASELGLSAINTPSSVKRSLTKEFKKDIPEDSNLSEKGLSATEVSANNNSKRKSEDSDGEENSEEWASDDDPDKLWCICRQPHNNRFMICCDGCEDWFHGTCVGVTKKQGRICEQEKRKWFCAKCRGEDPKKLLENKGIESVTENSPEKTPAKKPKIEEKKDDGLKKIRKTDDNKKKDQLDIKLKQKPRVLKTSANADKKEEEKLKKLIKSTKMEFKKKFRKEKDDKDKVQEKEKRKEPPSEPISKVVPIVKKPEDKKKKLKEQPIDLSFQDLFKAEPMMTKKSLNSPLAIPSPNTPTTPKITNMQSPFRKPSISGDTPSGNQPRKIAPLPSDLTCISCSKIFSSKPGKVTVYCSEVCIEKHVKDMLEVLKQTRSSPGPTKGEKRVVVFEKSSGRTMAGANAIAEDKILEYLKAHPSFEILKPNLIARRQSSESEGKKRDVPKSPTKKKEEPKKEEKKKDDFAVKQKPKSAQSPTDLNAGGDSRRESGPDSIRHNVRKALRETLTARYQEASEMRSVTQDDIKKIASRIEEEMYNYFNKDTSSKYRTRYRSLIFNLKDIKNEGLFRKVLTGKIEPSRLVRMSPEELASAELAKWREMENKHMLEMIKRDAEQQAQQVIVKKTHKGEELIETKPKKAIEEEGSGDNCMENKEGTLMVNTTFDDLLQEDTTSKHGEHVFDVRCKLCRNSDKKNAKNKDEPKRVRVELDEPTNKILQEAAKLSKDVKSGISSSRDLDPDQIPTSTTVGSSPEALPNQNKSCWKGIIFMQDVAKFVASGHKVSGTIESQDIPDFVQVCGRIAPEQVLDYVKKLKFSSRTEISVVRFSPTTHEEKTDYNAFFTYLNDRKRYGVVGASKSLKDFYILPLPQDVDPPEVLLPFSGPGLGKRHHRQNLLLGILIKSKKITEKHVSSKHTKEKQGQKTGIAENAPVPQERSYTPPPPVNCNNDTGVTEQEPYDPALSLTPPPKTQYTSSTPPLQEDITSSKDEEPYDPEDGSPVNTDNLGDLLEQISKSTNPTEMTSALLSKIANSATIEQQKRLLNELTNKVEESKKQLEEQRRAAEAAFSIATSSAANREKGSIPGLDGSFPTEEKSLQLPGNIKIPDNLKEILETVQRKTQEQEKSKVFDDPIVKTYGDENIEDPDEEEATKEETESKNSEPMELDEDSVKDDTILEVNNTKQSMDPRLRSKKQQPLGQDDKRVSQLRDDELMYKAQLQLKALKDMEMRQKNLEEAQKQAADAINKAASSHLSTASTSSVVIPSVTTSSSSTTPPDEAKPKIQIQWKKKPLITKT